MAAEVQRPASLAEDGKTAPGVQSPASMADHPESEIQKSFRGSHVFITGATGFVGKVLLEKLLRTCPNIGRIYVLVREKKGKGHEKRMEELYNNVIYDQVRKQNSDFTKKITIVHGDLTLPNLGISDEDRNTLLDNVEWVYHCAATVRFDEPMRTATYINVRATRDILLLAKSIKKLKSFIYISTAYSHCVRMDIGEKFYKPTLTGEKLLTLVDCLNDETLRNITPIMIGEWPNTYAYTKAIAEHVVESNSKGLPLAVVRPSIISPALQEPLPGYIDNLYGAAGVFLGAAVGLIRTLYCDKKALADMVPVDLVVNCTIAASWEVSNRGPSDEDPPIFNCVNSVQSPVTWESLMGFAEKHFPKFPSKHQVWHYCFWLNSNYYVHWFFLIFLQRVPAYIVDFIARCMGKKPMLVKGYQKIEKFMHVISYFSTKTWKFEDDNVQALWKKLSPQDKSNFGFGWEDFDWDSYYYVYGLGGRLYILKDPIETIPEGKIKYRKLQIAHYVLVTVLVLVFLKFMMLLWNVVFG